MSYLPCKNPNCHSYGKPHPNCKCYGEMAEGGEASFCSKPRPHEKSCEYYAEGGDVAPDFVPDEEAPNDAAPDFIPDDEAPKEESPDFIPDDKVPETADAAPDFIPDEGGDESNTELSPADLQAKMVLAAHPEGPSDYEAPLQQVAGIAEGLAQGALPIAATLAETKLLGVHPEDIAGRQEANPWEHGISEAVGMTLGVGKAIKAAKFGSALIKGAITNGLVQGGDEVSKWILGQGDPQDGVGASLARTGISTILGGLFGKAGELGERGAQSLAESKMGERLEYFLYGLASGAKKTGGEAPEALSEAATKGYNAGRKAFAAMTGKLLPATLGAGAEAYKGYQEDGVWGGIKGAGVGAIEGFVASLVGKGVGKISEKYAVPALLRVLANGRVQGAIGAIDHAANMSAGNSAVTNYVEPLFRSGSQQMVNAYGSPKVRQKLKDYIEGNEFDNEIQDASHGQNEIPQGFAEGGMVKSQREEQHSATSTHFPEHHVMMQAAKSRVVNYLNGLKPQKNISKLAFDDDPDTRDKEKSFNKALDIAACPLGILHEVHNGTIEPEHVQHFKAMYPEVDGLLQKRLTERITKDQLDGKKPSFKVRQGLSLLMGTPLSGEFTPANIQAAQNVFAQAAAQKGPNQPVTKNKKNTSTLSKSDDAYLTGSQAREKREQRVPGG